MGAESILTGCNLSAGGAQFPLFYSISIILFLFCAENKTQHNTMGELGSVESSFGGTSIFKQAGQIRREVQAPGSFKTLIGAGVLLIGLGICFAGLALTLREIRKFAKKPPRPQHGQ
ncbi:uncharacterized protein ACA1_326830 [Acanthamoeba castellanii str. Neff]|uniref:Uncharacterized protein n=1 Tax=Acanthamoeba castellanii (strain ATCC 30010 / Neff) TaxID=1257118 RepID=L8HJF8_ACACF|nr:uncharacterized protein ACA1_326830 [Acanthamoeba castellanii str. Neff]ELR25724.1 hypothetical protein ACA1_326830 [Acanthamoeba castellanii str. Neff]